jgi:tetrapyrrole methylase family protein/MazG family protein
MTITIIGLGPAGLGLVDTSSQERLLDESSSIIVRTLKHPASAEIAMLRSVVSCDDLYDTTGEFDDLYEAIAQRVVRAAADNDVVYAVPGSALIGERTVPLVQRLAHEEGVQTTTIPGQSFLDLVFASVGIDPITDGVQVVDARALPDPLPFHIPTVLTQVDSPLRAADTSVALGRTLDPDHPLTILDRLGDDDEVVLDSSVGGLATYAASERTSVYVAPVLSGLLGLVATNRVLRDQCPWDRKQTHHTLLTHLIEEAYEAADAISKLPTDAPSGEPDFGAYAEVEEELGDLLLQVIFHATLASESGAFDIDEVAEGIRRKLVARHPHVFGDVEVSGADEVLANWEQIKQEEKQRDSLMDDIPAAMPAMVRAYKVQGRAQSVGFDWSSVDEVVEVLRSEVDELAGADGADAVLHEVGDILFSAVNVARHVGVDPEVALRLGVDRFMDRFRKVETAIASAGSTMEVATLDDLEAAWIQAKDESNGS